MLPAWSLMYLEPELPTYVKPSKALSSEPKYAPRTSGDTATHSTISDAIGFVRDACQKCKQMGAKSRCLPTGSMEVNSWSNWEVSSEPATVGIQGEGIFPVASCAQSISRKKGCAFTSLASCSPEPRRALGSRTSRWDSRSLAF